MNHVQKKTNFMTQIPGMFLGVYTFLAYWAYITLTGTLLTDRYY